MSAKPKKSRYKKMESATSAPHLPNNGAVAPEPLNGGGVTENAPNTPQPSQTVMARPPAMNGQWQLATVLANPDNSADPIIQFGDNTRYLASQVQVSGPVSATTADPRYAGTTQAPPYGAISSLRPEYQEFQRQIVELFTLSMALFQMPLQSIITMAYRQAYRQQLEASGKMDVVSDQSMFVPDAITFQIWITSYLEEVQRREANANGPEA